MNPTTKATVLAAFALILIASLGNPAPAAAGCSSLCNGTFCEPDWDHPQWGCVQGAGVCYDEQCGAPSFATGEREAITAAAEAGDLELAQRLAAGHPTLRIFNAGGLVFNGPQLAGIAGPEAASEGIRVACASRLEATPAPPDEPAVEPVSVTNPK